MSMAISRVGKFSLWACPISLYLLSLQEHSHVPQQLHDRWSIFTEFCPRLFPEKHIKTNSNNKNSKSNYFLQGNLRTSISKSFTKQIQMCVRTHEVVKKPRRMCWFCTAWFLVVGRPQKWLLWVAVEASTMCSRGSEDGQAAGQS